jgi:hypothetical protein
MAKSGQADRRTGGQADKRTSEIAKNEQRTLNFMDFTTYIN